ncbi:FHA domain-containing protein FhaB/FipA [Bifidobacterium tibiigranuli]|uniref:FHA domain-containing protein n=1 Tax=Bifidobacterium tibiigranuli TaxID=2172043 RepID=A0A5N6S5D8_9BIFI|nr:FHA domain-containing protein [Bifidobacterium tibiigranuli]KAE8126900.1 FHA domain-containing protein [Bifidobacterium tibiigranuli]KAE8129832.1 FHA domain-containing protein [Bifidobacterium tibiigranuli]
MLTELTFAILKYGFLILLWVFAWLAVRSLHRDITSLSPRKSRAHRRAERRARKAASAPVAPAPASASAVAAAAASATPVTPATHPSTTQMPESAIASAGASASQPASSPALLVVIDGPLAGSSVPLGDEPITLGRASSNTVVMNDEFVSSHHARVYRDPVSGDWAIEDLGSTNGTAVNQRRISEPTVLAARVPVRIGATTFELR